MLCGSSVECMNRPLPPQKNRLDSNFDCTWCYVYVVYVERKKRALLVQPEYWEWIFLYAIRGG